MPADLRPVIRQSLTRAFVPFGKRSAIYVKRGQAFPPGIAAPEPRQSLHIDNLFSYLNTGELACLWIGCPLNGDSLASKARHRLWEAHGFTCENAAYAASLLAGNDVRDGDL